MRKQKQVNKLYQFHGWTIVDEGGSWCAYNPAGQRLINNIESSDVVENLIVNVFENNT